MKILEVLTPRRKIGNKGEKIAARHLKRLGYKILRRNYAPFDNEIDIIAEDREHIIFVEVKTRSTDKMSAYEARPASAVTEDKQRRIISTAKYYVGGLDRKKKLRFDVIEVYLDKKGKPAEVIHMENAFNHNTAYKRKVY